VRRRPPVYHPPREGAVRSEHPGEGAEQATAAGRLLVRAARPVADPADHVAVERAGGVDGDETSLRRGLVTADAEPAGDLTAPRRRVHEAAGVELELPRQTRVTRRGARPFAVEGAIGAVLARAHL